jgi:peroxiredoxin
MNALILVSALLLNQSYGPKVKADPNNPQPGAIGRKIPNFVLPLPNDKKASLSDFNESKSLVFVFLSTNCPVSNAYIPTLNELSQKYKKSEVQFIGVYANSGDNKELINNHVRDFKISFPVVYDAEQITLRLFGTRRSSEAFVLDQRRNIQYQGRIDDQISNTARKEKPTINDLANSIDQVLNLKKVTVAFTEPPGCLITHLSKSVSSKITYESHIAGLLFKHCADCHHPGTAAPFSLLSYEDAKNNGAMIKEVTSLHTMPPWHADTRFGHFANERKLSSEEVAQIASWVDAGMPAGDLAKAPKPPAFSEGWRLGKPDIVFQIPEEVTVQAKGTVGYKYFSVKTNFKEDMWLKAAEPRPGNRSVVHHIIVFYREPGKGKRPVWIAATAPGAEPVIHPEGMGRKIPAGSDIIWQIHYTPTGKEEKDRSEVAFVFCKEKPKQNIETHGIANNMFLIPPLAFNHEVVSSITTKKDAVILTFFPHMHLRGKDFEYQVHYPDGKVETILSVPQYDFNWQNTYRLKEPLKIPKGSKIKCVAHFDNSKLNPANPAPWKPVFFGEQTWEEMMIGYIDFYYVDEVIAPNAAVRAN